MIYHIKIPTRDIIGDIELRNIIEDTIEERGIAEIVNIGVGEDYFDMTIQCESESITQIQSLLQSMGMDSFEIAEVD